MTTRQKKVAGVLAIASVVLAWRVYVICTDYLPTPAEGSPVDFGSELAVVPPDAVVQPNAKEAALWSTQAQMSQRPWGRDPFERLSAVAAAPVDGEASSRVPSPPPFKLSGVSRADGQWKAIVGGRIVGVEDVLDGGYKVTEIGMNSITVTSKGQTFELTIGSKQQSRRVLTPGDRGKDGPALMQGGTPARPGTENSK